MKLNRKVLGFIYDSCGGCCFYCGVHLPPFSKWEVDHMNPTAKGGEDTFYNVVAACCGCNRSKGNRTVEEFREALLRRAQDYLARALGTISIYVAEPDTDYGRALSFLRQAGESLMKADIIFHGEAVCLPRKDDPLFSEAWDREMMEFDEEADDIETPGPVM